MTDHFWRKFRSLKEVQYSTDPQRAALRRCRSEGYSLSAALRGDTPTQKQALCDLIDAIAANGGDVIDAWTVRKIAPEEGKCYVMESK